MKCTKFSFQAEIALNAVLHRLTYLCCNFQNVQGAKFLLPHAITSCINHKHPTPHDVLCFVSGFVGCCSLPLEPRVLFIKVIIARKTFCITNNK